MNQKNSHLIATMAASKQKLHIVMFPWSGFGHMINYLELSKFIAQKGHKVSFVSTTRNIDRLPNLNLPQDLSSLITFVKLNLPKQQGLPETAEATIDVSRNQIPLLMQAIDALEPELTRFLETESPDWIIYDFAAYWIPDVAAKLGISRAYFSTFNAWFIAFAGSSSEDMINDYDVRKTPEDWLAPPPWVSFPSKVALKAHELDWTPGDQNATDVSLVSRWGRVINGSDAILIRHCMEFEPEWITLLEKLHQKPVVPVGLMPPSAQESRDDDENETWLDIKYWLDMQKKGSMVYVALGSEVPLSQEQLTELALGLELSRLPFFWALRKPPTSLESNSIELPNGFLERTKGRGMVWTSWAPQLKILRHDSVGCFLTHCGWGSLIEGMMFGHPLIMLPFYADQGPNARVIADNGMGIEVTRNEDGSFSRECVSESLNSIMDADEGGSYRGKVKEISAINGDKELHDYYIDNVVGFLETHRAFVLAKRKRENCVEEEI